MFLFSKMCENKGPVMRQRILRTRSFAFFVAGFDAEQLEKHLIRRAQKISSTSRN